MFNIKVVDDYNSNPLNAISVKSTADGFICLYKDNSTKTYPIDYRLKTVFARSLAEVDNPDDYDFKIDAKLGVECYSNRVPNKYGVITTRYPNDPIVQAMLANNVRGIK